jgi:hypothetical protein
MLVAACGVQGDTAAPSLPLPACCRSPGAPDCSMAAALEEGRLHASGALGRIVDAATLTRTLPCPPHLVAMPWRGRSCAPARNAA